jgi:hypothetical protein
LPRLALPLFAHGEVRQINGNPASGSPFADALRAAGYRSGLHGFER